METADSSQSLAPIYRSAMCHLGTKIDQTGDNTTEIKHRIDQTRKAINALNSILWHKDITKKQKIIYLSNNNSEHFDV